MMYTTGPASKDWINNVIENVIEDLEDDYEPPKPGIPCKVLFRYLKDEDGEFTEIYDYTPDESDIFWVLEGPGLEYIIEGFDYYKFEDDKWYVIDGLRVYYHTDYWGEVDEEWNYDHIRLATQEEIEAGRLV